MEQRSHVVVLSLALSLYHHIQKMTKRAKSRSFRGLLVVRMLIMIIFLAPIGDWLAFYHFFSLARHPAQKDVERERKENTICFAMEKEEEKNDEKRIFSASFWPFHALGVFSLSLLLSLFLFLRSTRKNRLIVSFYKFPCLSSLVRRAKSRRRARARERSPDSAISHWYPWSLGRNKEKPSRIT